MGDLSIRTATAADLDALRDVFRRASLSNEGDRETLHAHPEVLEFGGEWIEEGRTRVAVIDGRVVGFATALELGNADDVEDLFVDPDWMRHGIGLALMRDLVDRARARGARFVEVTANSHALAFYTAAGFQPRGEADTPFGRAARLHIVL